ncbi:glycerate kinase [Pullulanibacillus camelliae]|uniref:Glycerate kinase n=1 Tax=Pullulanibacillus camelliae TaxID=1707096 RepID=A0A8J2VJP6_9BACL|nr:glycerate kinase [Pullulanibacillus camelliae]GGE27881.1 glycerate kinase [Pullulanibacillus camelliae]
MNVILSPDSFKGCLSSVQVCQAMARGIKKATPDAEITCIPMADGGEGTTTSLVAATEGDFMKDLSVHDPLGRPIKASYGVTGDGKTAIIELAAASGLDLLEASELDPRLASTLGTGELILDALDQGLRSFIICLGGSATNDGGTGLLKALGFRFLDQAGDELSEGGWALKHLQAIDMTQADARLKESHFQIACDVSNPLIGNYGASAVFGPQKGATPEMISALDQALARFADVVEQDRGLRLHDLKGAGAAGGTAAGLLAFLNAELVSGIELVKQTIGFDDRIQNNRPDLILTGEGKIDAQTSFGKVIAGICQSAKPLHIPVIALAGATSDELAPLHEAGLAAAFSIADGPLTLEESIERAETLIEKTTEQVIRIIAL